MVRGLYKHRCCPPDHPSPVTNACFLDGIIKAYERLQNYGHCKFYRPNERIELLALPRHLREPFKPKCACRFKKETRLEHVNNPFVLHTRTELLALPQHRKIEHLKKEYRSVLGKDRLNVLNKYERKSILSMYSRIQTTKVKEAKPPVTPYMVEQLQVKREKLTKYLEARAALLAMPHQRREPPPPVEGFTRICDYEYLQHMAKPKKTYEYTKPEWTLTRAMAKHKPSDNEQKLATPRIYEGYEPPRELPVKVSPDAMTYKITRRMKFLAEPKALRMQESDLKENPFAVAPDALKYRLTKHTRNLAMPKEYPEDKHNREDITVISPKALNYKITPRLAQLALPKKRDFEP